MVLNIIFVCLRLIQFCAAIAFLIAPDWIEVGHYQLISRSLFGAKLKRPKQLHTLVSPPSRDNSQRVNYIAAQVCVTKESWSDWDEPVNNRSKFETILQNNALESELCCAIVSLYLFLMAV